MVAKESSFKMLTWCSEVEDEEFVKSLESAGGSQPVLTAGVEAQHRYCHRWSLHCSQ